AQRLLHSFPTRRSSDLEGFLGDEAGLRHGSAYGVHDQQHGIHHRQNPLYLTAEVGVSGGVHDVDAVIVPFDRRVFGEDGDPPFAFLVIAVHNQIAGVITTVEGAGLTQQLVNHGGFTVVNVGDDGDITQFFDSGLVCH